MKRSKQSVAGAEDSEADGGRGDVGRGSVRRCRQKKAEEDQASDIPLDSEPDSDYDEDEGGCTSKSAKKEKNNKKAKQPEHAGKGEQGFAQAAVLLCRCSRADLGWSNCMLV